MESMYKAHKKDMNNNHIPKLDQLFHAIDHH